MLLALASLRVFLLQPLTVQTRQTRFVRFVTSKCHLVVSFLNMISMVAQPKKFLGRQVKAHLHYGENCTKLGFFKVQNIFYSLKHTSLNHFLP